MKASATTHNFHVPLPSGVYDRLKTEAQRQGKPATSLVKQALESWLEEQERLAVHEEIARYAASAAGSTDDLDPDLEGAAVEELQQQDRRP